MTVRNQIPMALRAAYLALHRRSEVQFSKLGVTADQFVLLATLHRGKALTQRELAQRMPSDPSTVRAMLVLLERNGLVKRDSHPNDSRARTAALTSAGKRKFQQLWTAGEPIREEMFGSLQPDETQLLVSLLVKVTESIHSGWVAVSGQRPNHRGEVES